MKPVSEEWIKEKWKNAEKVKKFDFELDMKHVSRRTWENIGYQFPLKVSCKRGTMVYNEANSLINIE